MLCQAGEAHVYDFATNVVVGSTDRDRGYWRGVGSLDAYYAANLDLVQVNPVFNLYNLDWPILTYADPLPPAKFVLEEPGRTGMAINSMICAGTVISGGVVRQSILSPGVGVHSFAEVDSSVLM